MTPSTGILDHEGKPIKRHGFYKQVINDNIIFVEAFLGKTWYGSNSYHPDINDSDNIKISSSWFKGYSLIENPQSYQHPCPDKREVEKFIKSKLEQLAKSNEPQIPLGCPGSHLCD